MTDGIGQVIQAFAMIGVAGVVYVVTRLLGKKPQIARTREVPPERVLHDTLTAHINDQAKREQKEVSRAVNGDSAADALAEIGNRRRGE